MTPTRRTLIAGALGTAFLAGCGDSRSGVVDDSAAMPAAPDGRTLTLRKVGTIGSPWLTASDPLMCDDVIAVEATPGEGQEQSIRAYETSSLKPLWQWPLRESSDGRQTSRRLCGTATHGFLVAEQKASGPGMTSTLLLVRARDRAVTWRAQLPRIGDWPIVLDAWEMDGVILVRWRDSPTEMLLGLDAATGRQLWSRKDVAKFRGSSGSHLLWAAGESSTQLALHDPRTGRKTGQFTSPGGTISSWEDGRVLVTSPSPKTGQAGDVYDLASGKLLLKVPFWPKALGTSSDGTVLVAGTGDDPDVFLTMTSGSTRPQRSVPNRQRPEPSQVERGVVWCTSSTGFQSFDRSGRALAPEIPGTMKMINDRWIISERDLNVFVLYALT